ncbi:uncharacterized protein EAF01_003832 [Botrytis porri]|uniref:uncharacterized protein n=1 Tax=Botrytis porri TaxID=87229 RepID=UPI0019008657|nr:uncharacterized protein EAF01_003832 [Botrytis porri]KAF7908077.1 hypothetical protein EAF01_003832 [Botrytis porri]
MQYESLPRRPFCHASQSQPIKALIVIICKSQNLCRERFFKNRALHKYVCVRPMAGEKASELGQTERLLDLYVRIL